MIFNRFQPMRDVYIYPILNNTQRLLGLLDRNVSSDTYGCFDRDYWHYNIVDFPCARKQESVLTLALLYLINHKDNGFYQNREIFDYIIASLRFWCSIQNKNGSFNEWYPYENSFVATAFTSYAISESVLLLKDHLHQDVINEVIRSLIKSASWLMKRQEIRVMNQQTGAIAALYNIYLLTGEKNLLSGVKEKVEILRERQSEEGWFIEYGGPDIGYLSLAIDYLCKYYKRSGDRDIEGIINKAMGFLRFFIQPNLVAGGEYASRNTEYLIPHGFELFSRYNVDARFIASVIRKSLSNINSFPYLFDDRYLSYVGYTWLQAYKDANPEIDDVEDIIKSGFNTNFKNCFQASGLFVLNDQSRHLIVNMKKGGSLRLFDKHSNNTHIDSGIMVRSGDRWFTSGWLSEADTQLLDNSIIIEGMMKELTNKRLTPFIIILMRLFQIVFGRATTISLWVKERLRDLLITKTKTSKMVYKRIIEFDSEPDVLLKVKDSIVPNGKSISEIVLYAKDTHIYVPSSRYYATEKGVPFIKRLINSRDKIVLEWEIRKGEREPVFF